MTDQERLLRFAEALDEDAFAEFVRGHVDLVYHVACRRVAGRELAEEVCQEVFLAVARKARPLAKHPALHAWLFRATVYQCSRVHRSHARRERRRQEIENHLLLMTDPSVVANNEVGDETLCILDECVDTLKAKDRELVLRRFYKEQSFQDIGEHLGISENASQKRMTRVLQKLERLMARHAAVTTTGLIACLSANSSKAAPSGMADMVCRRVLESTAYGAGGATVGGYWLATHFKAAVTAILLGFSLPMGAHYVTGRSSEVTELEVTMPHVQRNGSNQTQMLAQDPLFGKLVDPAEQMRRILELEDKDQRLHEIRFLVRHLKRSEREQALSVVAEREPEDLDHIGAFLESWARLDADAALAFMDTRLPPHRKRYLKDIMRGWVNADPEDSWRFVTTSGEDPLGVLALDSWVQEMSLTDPLKALRMLTESSEHALDHHFTQLFANWSDERVDVALSAIAAIADDQRASRAVRALAEASQVTLDDDFMTEARGIIGEPRFQEFEATLLGAWLGKEPRELIAYLEQIENLSERAQLAHQALKSGWIHDARGEVVAFVEANQLENAANFVKGLYPAWLVFDAQGAIEHFHRAEPALQREVAAHLGSYLGQRAPNAVFQEGLRLTDAQSREALFVASVEEIVALDLPRALTLLRQVDDEGVYRSTLPAVAEAYAKQDPEAAAAWVVENATDEQLPKALASVLEQWAMADQPATATWFDHLENADLKDTSAAAISKGSLDHPQVAAAWAYTVADEGLRLDALSQVATRWTERDASGFHAWFGLQPEPVRRALLAEEPSWADIIENQSR